MTVGEADVGVKLNLIKSVALGALWIALALFLGSDKAANHDTTRVIAAAIFAFPTAWAFVNYLLRPWAQLNEPTRRELENILQKQLLAIDAAGAYPDVPALSFHVWTLPQWYQIMLNFKWYRGLVKRKRLRYKEEGRRARRGIDPTLRRAARVGFRTRQPTGVKFRNGEGIVGRCVHQNLKKKASTVALDSAAFQDALVDDDRWKQAPLWIQQNLRRRPAEKLATIYGQVAAEVLQREGYAIGCVTLDLPPNSSTRLTDNDGNLVYQPILDHLQVAGDDVEQCLTR